MSARKLAKDAPGMPWAVYFDALGVKPEHLKSIIVWQPKFMKAVGELVASTPLEDVKAYLRWHAVNAAGAYLGQEILEQDFWFHEKVLLGRKEMRPLWKQVVAELDSSVGELLGSEYVKVHFPPAAVKRMDVLIKDLIDAYEARIKALGWMSEPTKKQALIKLKATSNKIGFPKKPEEYKSLKVDPKSYLENRWQSGRFAMRKSLRRLGRPVDLQEWHMNAHAVNAYSNPNLNEIVFPAGILQAPFFHPEWSDALNYGAIGGVIGHELTHGFDDMGSKFDEKGNMRGWWRAADRRKFEAETQRLVKQFDACEVIDGLRCNGKLTLGENLADLGGMEIAYDAFRKRAGGTAQKKTRGLTPDQEFLLAFAQIECGTRRPEALRNQVLTDPHAPHELRVNETVKNMDVFHEAFGTKPGDQLYVKPEDRVRIW